MDTQQSVSTVLENVHEGLARQGRKFQPEFVDVVADDLLYLVDEWLEKHAPENIREAFNLGRGLKMSAQYMQAGDMTDINAEDLLDTIPQATRLIWELGGNWHTMDGCITCNPNTTK